MSEFVEKNESKKIEICEPKCKNRNAKVEMSKDYEIFSAHVSQFLSTFTEVNKKVNRTNQKCARGTVRTVEYKPGVKLEELSSFECR